MFPASNLLAAVRVRRAEYPSGKLKEPEQAMAAPTAIIAVTPQTERQGAGEG